MSRGGVVWLPVALALAISLSIGSNRCSKTDDHARGGAARSARSEEAAPSDGSPSDPARSVRSADDGSGPEARRLTSIDARVLAGNSVFAFGLFERVCGSGQNRNICVSPLSVSIALAMTHNGASAKTAEEMAGVLGFSGVDLEELNRSMAELTADLALADSSVRLTVANSLWARKGFEFRPDFLERNNDFYRAKTATLDFADPGAVKTINRWVEESTGGLIERIVDAIDPEVVLYLINAIYFKGSWETAFDPEVTRPAPFHTAGGAEKSVQMMSRSGSFRYAEAPDLQVVRVPYGEGRIAMYVFLPSAEDGLDEFLRDLDHGAFSQRLSSMSVREGAVSMPRFKFEYQCGLVPALKSLGMKAAFDPSTADFSKMASESVFISEVKHKTVVDVSEEGTKAAAVTSVEMKVTSVEPPGDRFTFTADRPFFFVIRDDGTGSVIFLGAVNDPSA